MKSHIGLALAVSVVLSSAEIRAQDLPTVDPTAVGFSKERLDQIAAHMQEHIDAERISGATGLIARKGKVAYFESYGWMDRENQSPMRKDAIFRIYSMSKAVTGVAIMILYDEGLLALEDPLSKFVPEFSEMHVVTAHGDSDSRLSPRFVSARRQITILDLLRHTAGISYEGPRDKNGRDYFDIFHVRDGTATIEETVKRLAKCPLWEQPGTTWRYGYSIDVLGRVVEVASGMTFDQFLEKRIFAPLGMVDSAFHVPEQKWDRLATLYTPNEDGTVRRSDSPAQDQYNKRAVCFAGGQGLVSTTMDYTRFCQMLLNQGELNGRRILSRESVQLMQTDHLGDRPRAGSLIGEDTGFGLTFAIKKSTDATGAQGTYLWGGAAGTRFWIDPENELFGVFMVQILPHRNLKYGDEFKQLVYAAVE